jgi:hypothetical protein
MPELNIFVDDSMIVVGDADPKEAGVTSDHDKKLRRGQARG